MNKKYSICIAILILFFSTNLSAQNTPQKYSPVSPELYNAIARMDSLMFVSYNAHDLEKLMTWFSNDLEFYHDKGGLVSFDQTRSGLKSVFEKNNKIRRELVKGSLEVYPIKDYGAVEIGLHKFCHDENGKEDCGTFKFVHVWQNKDGVWKVTRVVSYDH